MRKNILFFALMFFVVLATSSVFAGTIAVRVFNDVDDDGNYLGNTGIPGIVVRAYQYANNNEKASSPQTTDNGGWATFDGVGGKILIKIEKPDGWKYTTDEEVVVTVDPNSDNKTRFGLYELPSVEIKDKSASEAIGDLKFIVQRTDPSDDNYKEYNVKYTFATVQFNTMNNPNAALKNEDYTHTWNQEVTIPATKDIRHAVVPVNNDEYLEDDEIVKCKILKAWIDDGSETPIAVTGSPAVGTIQNDDVAPEIWISSPDTRQKEEDKGKMYHTVSIVKAGTTDPSKQWHDVFFTFKTVDGLATVADNDFVEENPSAEKRLPGKATRLSNGFADALDHIGAAVTMVGDTKWELDENLYMELVSAVLRLPSGDVTVPIVDGEGKRMMTILNDDPMPTLCVADGEEYEGDEGDANLMNFKVELSNPSAFPISFKYFTAGQSAAEGVDFKKVGGKKVNVPVGDDCVNVTVELIGDKIPESDEMFKVFLKNSKMDVPPQQQVYKLAYCDEMPGMGTILDDDGDYCANFDSDRNVGLAPVMVNYISRLKTTIDYEWYLDINVKSPLRNPSYGYWTETMQGKPWDPQLNGANFLNFVQVYPAGGLGHLQVVEGSPVLKEYSWDNAVDGDIYWHNGTAIVGAEEVGGKPWAIFEFSDQGTRAINKIRLMNDTGICDLNLYVDEEAKKPTREPEYDSKTMCSSKYVSKFKVYTSTDGDEWIEVLDAHKELYPFTPCDLTDDWEEWEIPATEAKYVKLEICAPTTDVRPWILLGEFEVWFDATMADDVQSSIAIEGENFNDNGQDAAELTLTIKDGGGNPIEGLTDHDIKLFTKQVKGNPGIDPAVCVEDVFSSVKEVSPGIYQATLTSTRGGEKQIMASVNGVVLHGGTVQFGLATMSAENVSTGDCDNPSKLVFISGSETYAKGYMQYDWSNAVDGDLDGWDGTVRARGLGNPSGDAWAIFRFCNGEPWNFNWIRLQTENGEGEVDQATRFEIWTSTTDDNLSSFTKVATFDRKGNGEERWYATDGDQEAVYVMLKLVEPVNRYKGDWRQIVEFSLDSSSKTGPWQSDGSSDITALPDEFSMDQNYPNPFNPVTTINYTLPSEGHVSLMVYNLQGKQVAKLVDGYEAAGVYSVRFDASELPSGIYLYQIKAGQFTASKRMVLMK